MNNPQLLSITAGVDGETNNNCVSSKQNVNISCIVDITRFSSFKKLLNTTAYIYVLFGISKHGLRNKSHC